MLDEFDKSLELGFPGRNVFHHRFIKKYQQTNILHLQLNAVVIPDFIGLKEPVRLNFLTGIENADWHAGG